MSLAEIDQTPVQQPAKPSDAVRRLTTALRSPLPEGFAWDFRDGPACACGLAHRLGILDEIDKALDEFEPLDPLSATEKDGLVPLYGVPARSVTPAMVADALERLIEGGGRG